MSRSNINLEKTPQTNSDKNINDENKTSIFSLFRGALSCFVKEICCCPCVTLGNMNMENTKKRLRSCFWNFPYKKISGCLAIMLVILYIITWIIAIILILCLAIPSYRRNLYEESYDLCSV